MARKEKPTLEFYYDITCPFAYMGSLRVEALARRADADLIWTPVLLGAIYRETAAPQGAAGSASDVFNPTKKRITSRALRRTLQRNNIDVKWPSVHPRSPVLALRLLYSVPTEERPALTRALYRAYWVHDQDITNKRVLLEVASKSGIPCASQLSESLFDDKDAQDALRRETAKVIARGAPGLPSFWIAEEKCFGADGKARHGRLYWGQDRMHFVEAALLSLRHDGDSTRVPDLANLQPRCLTGPPKGKKRVEFWYDFSSPWAFLGWTQLDRLKRQFGSDVEIVMKPILLGALFKAVGAPNVPMAVISEARRKYTLLDLADWTRHWNAINVQQGSHDKPVELRWPDHFPIRSPTLLRLAIVDPDLVPLLFRASWELNINVSSEETLARFLSSSGHDPTTLLAKAASPPVKHALRLNTAEAIDAGVCGVPSYRVSEKTDAGEWDFVASGVEGGVVWGQDEMVVVEDLVAGWKQEQEQEGTERRGFGGYDLPSAAVSRGQEDAGGKL